MARDKVLAVLVFFMFEEREKDSRQVSIVCGIAAQVGSVIRWKQAQEQSAQHARQLVKALHDLQETQQQLIQSA